MSRLFVSEFGDPKARPVVFFHGFPGSHIQSELLKPWLESLHLRVLAFDRPGYGQSAPLEGGLKALAQSLDQELAQRGLSDVYLLGVSGGNPAAVSMAAHLGSRALGLACVCGLAPFPEATSTFSSGQAKSLNLVRRMPESLLRLVLGTLVKASSAEALFEQRAKLLDSVDQKALSDPKLKSLLLTSIEQARQQGSKGLVFDLKSYTSAWPVAWSKVTCPVSIWHGEQDLLLSPKMAQFLHQKLPQSKLNLVPDEGHYSLPINLGAQILRALLPA